MSLNGLKFAPPHSQADRNAVIIVIVIVVTFYLPSCLGKKTAKGSFGLRVKLPPAHLSTTHGRGFKLPF